VPADASMAVDAVMRDEWHRAGWHGRATLAEVMRVGFDANAGSFKIYRSAERPRRATLREIDLAGRRLASTLWGLGLRPGDAVAVQLPNWFENDVTIRAAVQLGLVFVPVVHTYGPAELSFILQQSGAKALFVPDRFRNVDSLERVAKLSGTPALEHIIVVGETAPSDAWLWSQLVEQGSAQAPEPALDADDVCAMFYTSGTTSDPKGVQHTHNSLLAERGGAATLVGRTPQSSLPSLQLFPAGHIAGALGTIFMFAASTTTVAFDTFGPDLAVQAIEEFGLASTGGPPVFLSGLLDLIDSGQRNLSSLTSFVVGAASVPPYLVERADALGVKAFRCYGSSEHPTVSSSTPQDPLFVRAWTDGPCLPGNQVRIVDDDGNDLATGLQGEITTLGPELFVGYRDRRMNEGAFLPGGWFRTGDLGVIDRDGNLVVTDRKKDIIIRGGENISAKEIEDILARHPAVAEAAVVAMPDPRLGERVCAFVVTREGERLDLAEVGAFFAQAGLGRHKTPERLEVVDDLPRTPAGKVKKSELRSRFR